MKKKFFLITAILTMGLAVGTFIASCSSDSDEPTYENNAQRIEAMKAKVLKLAEMYGLEVSIEEGFEQQCLQEHFLDSLEVDFMRISQLKGYYTLITTEGNKLSFDSGREKLLKQRRSTVGEREYSDYSGQFQQTHNFRFDEHYLSLNYKIEWSYNTNVYYQYVRIIDGSLELNHSSYYAEISGNGSMNYQFIGAIPNFIYSFRVKIKRYSSTVNTTLTISGGYNNGQAYEDSSYHPTGLIKKKKNDYCYVTIQ